MTSSTRFAESRYYGSSNQLFGMKPYRVIGGKADGTFCVDLYNKIGIQLTVVPDRGMDILSLKNQGTNMGYLSKTGLVGPKYFVEQNAHGFMKNFFAGFLTTGGLSYMGTGDESHGLHGTISNTPAYRVSMVEDDGYLAVTGEVKEAEMYGVHLVLQRTIKLAIDRPEIEIIDQVTNHGFSAAPLMLLYHMNFGYPLLSPGTVIELPEGRTFARDGRVLDNRDPAFRSVTDPADDGQERVVFHRPAESAATSYCLRNPTLGRSVRVHFSPMQLPYLNEWQSFVSGDYVLGLEPGTNDVNGRAQAIENGELQQLNPGETKEFVITVELS